MLQFFQSVPLSTQDHSIALEYQGKEIAKKKNFLEYLEN